MKQLKNMQIIGIDHGYGNLKIASGIFPASVLTFDHEPVHAQDLLIYDGKYHVIGSGHREFTPDKVGNRDHYILTLAGIGQELWKNRMTEARVYIAAGLPLTWVESQREASGLTCSRTTMWISSGAVSNTTSILWARMCMRRAFLPSCPCSGSSRA